ncbi:hypothetical protein KDK95_18470 [Actinospica sp. MGRD01-02]|uniref:Uncharacterized protein n=1 Tax=Actinospica acidithermotolerans TaxID=2828514 RepID=A0A941EIK6_9ACTN|nr:hypothetical protein [Actinospica acidithermotolerans]MBR7828304.1 hypothetical protein [Actinospica acidithermotolerans]
MQAYFLRRLARSSDPQRIFTAVRAVVAETRVLRSKVRRALDSRAVMSIPRNAIVILPASAACATAPWELINASLNNSAARAVESLTTIDHPQLCALRRH